YRERSSGLPSARLRLAKEQFRSQSVQQQLTTPPLRQAPADIPFESSAASPFHLSSIFPEMLSSQSPYQYPSWAEGSNVGDNNQSGHERRTSYSPVSSPRPSACANGHRASGWTRNRSCNVR